MHHQTTSRGLVLAAVPDDIRRCRSSSFMAKQFTGVAPDDPSFLFPELARCSAAAAAFPAPALAAEPAAPAIPGLARRVQDRAAAKGISQAAISSGLNGVTLDQAVLNRDHPEGLQPEFRGVFRPHGAAADHPRRQHAEAIRLGARPHRAGLRRARRGAGGDLGVGDRFRRQHRKVSDHPLAGDAGL